MLKTITFVLLLTLCSQIKAQELTINETTEAAFCFDREANSNDKELIEDFDLLSAVGLFDQNNCLIEKNKEGSEAFLARFIKKNLDKKIKIYAVTNEETKRSQLVYTNSDNKEFINNSLTSKDKWQIAGLSVASIAVGSIISEQIYKGQADKVGHRKAGAKISGLTTGLTYLLLESAGLGDRLNLSKEAKKNLIMMSGPIMAVIAGTLKEVYDYHHRDVHTPDINDDIATSLGGGFPLIMIQYTFK